MYQESPKAKLAKVSILTHHVPPVPKMPARYTDEDWDFNNRVKIHIMDDNQKLAKKILQESKRVADETKEATISWQHEVEHLIKDRADEVRFALDELTAQKQTSVLEEQVLNAYCNRVIMAVEYLRRTSFEVTQNCLIKREGRLGVDLVDDEVDRQLRIELRVTEGCVAILDKLAKEATEQLRKLRAIIYLLDIEMGQKDKTLLIDQTNLDLKQSAKKVKAQMDLIAPKCTYSVGEWYDVTYQNYESNARELHTSTELVAYIDVILKQVIGDMEAQTKTTNEAFELRISELQEVKEIIEKKHADNIVHIREVNENLIELEKEIADREESLHLCLVRISNRTKRPGMELTCDAVDDALIAESRQIQHNINKLKNKVLESKTTLRYLKHIQMMQEEEINIKANSIKIDEADCLPTRTRLQYFNF